MEQKTEPCPLCGKEEDSWENKIKEKEQQEKHLRAFIAGRESLDILSKRENEVIDCFFNKGMNDFRMIATLLRVSPSAIETYYDRAMDKLMNMDFEL
jgi:DNA-directed RNA polymerase specialized sigma subunit